MQVDYQAPIRGIAKIILSLLVQLTKMFTNRIKDVELRTMATAVLGSAEATIKALSDANPNDREQLRNILNSLMNKTEFQASAQEEIMSHISKLSNEQVKTALSILNSQAFPVANLLTDDDTDNSEQLREYLVELLQSPDGIALFNALLSIVLPKEYANTLTLIIIQFLVSFLEEDSEEDEQKSATVKRLRKLQGQYQIQVAAA